MVTAAKRYAAIGNFDGVHRGHQFLLSEMIAAADGAGAEPGAIVFEPHPRRFFRPADPPFLLTTRARRAALLAEAGARFVTELPFDAGLVATSPEAFVRGIVKTRLGLAGVAVGSEFRFGSGRAGDAASLKRLCDGEGLHCAIIRPLMDGAEKFGSTAVRAALQRGEARAAADMLGRPWEVEGPVAEGRRMGRTIGFATANLTLGPLIEPRPGVYAVRVFVRGSAYQGVANFGRRPTFGESAPLLETHLFDFAGDLYGEIMRVEFIEFLRDERKFEGVDALKAQIASDCAAARRALSRA